MPAAEQFEATKERIREFWEREPCGVTHTDAAEGTAEFYTEVERQRAEAEPFIPEFADFEGARDKRVLEIGVGLGSDFVRFARAGAVATGVDLTEHGVALVRRRLELEGLGAEVVRADAESLPFPDGSFDRIYSWGVLHHTPQTGRAVAEALRVLERGGTFCIMLYGRYSWVALALWAKYGLLRGRFWRSLADVLAHHMESEGTKGYTRRELRAMFRDARDVRIDSVVTVYDRNFLGPFARVMPSRRLGWFMVVRGRR